MVCILLCDLCLSFESPCKHSVPMKHPPRNLSQGARYASNLSPIRSRSDLDHGGTRPFHPTASQQEQSAEIFQMGVGYRRSSTQSLKNLKQSRFVGFCDVDQLMLDKVGKDYPDAWNCHDYREAFANQRIHSTPLSWTLPISTMLP